MGDDDVRKRLAAEVKRLIATRPSPRSTAQSTPAKRAVSDRRRRTDGQRSDPSERPISFTSDMLDAVLAGRKTQTRRPITPIPHVVADGIARRADGTVITPLYRVGDRLWVREKWARSGEGFVYDRDRAERARWQAARFMPRAAARTFLRVTDVRAVRLCEIDEAAAHAEGIAELPNRVAAFMALWDSIYGETEFAARRDPWVWAVRFEPWDEA